MKTPTNLRTLSLLLFFILFTLPTFAQVWQEEQKTLPTSFPADISSYTATYGYSVDIDGTYAVISAVNDDGNANRAGAAFVYEYDGNVWQLVKRLAASDAADTDLFGFSVAISGANVVIGAYFDDTPAGVNSGSAYVFNKDQGGVDNWGEVKKLTATDGAAGDGFGISVDILGGTIVVGAYADDDLGADSGSAYIFWQNVGGANNWGQMKKLTAADGAAGDYFGRAVAISGVTVVIGADRDDTPLGTDSGSAYIFERDQGGTFNYGQVKKLMATDGVAADYFGISVDISGGRIVVGAIRDDDLGANSGSAYIFNQNVGGTNNWGQEKKLTAADGAANDVFGYSVGLYGANVIVGARNKNTVSGTSSGSAYIFNQNIGGVNNWGQVKKLTAADGAANDYFGWSVAMFGTTVIAGSPFNDAAGTDNGAAYFFAQDQGGTNNWGQTQKTLPVGPPTFGTAGTATHYGYSVAIDGNYAVVSAHNDDEKAMDVGAAYIYYFDGSAWQLQKKLMADDGATSDLFAVSVAIDGTTVVVGAPYDDTPGGTDAGSVYVFSKDQGGINNWGQVKKITAADGAASDLFGWSVDISGTTVVVGAYVDDTPAGTDAGSAYVFSKDQGGINNWGQAKKIIASDGASSDEFGVAVAIAGTTLAVGAFRADTPDGTDAGKVYLFNQDQGGINNWGQVKILTADDGATEDIFGFTVALSATNLVVGAHGDDNSFGTNAGAAYMFGKDIGGADNWGQVKKFTASDGGGNDNFGSTVAITGTNIVIGAYLDDTSLGTDAGSAYVFSKDLGGIGNWGEVEKITASDGATSDQYGFSVAISGDFTVIGSVLADEVGSDQGAAYFYTQDVIPPEVSITSAVTSPTNTSPIPITITFTEEVIGFAVGDITVGNGSAGNLQTSDNTVFTADITPAADDEVTIDIAAGIATDLASNDNLAATQLSITYDTSGPIIILSPTGDKVFNNTFPFEMTITATEEIAMLNLAALEVTNGTAANLQTTDNITFTVDITPITEGMVLTDILVNTVTDLAGNDPFFTLPVPVIYDITAPEVTLSTTVSSPLAAMAIPVTIVFNEKSLLEVSGITVSNGTAANLVTTDSLTYTVDITATAEGEVTVDILANGATDLAENGNNAGNQLTVTVDTTAPTVTVSSSAGSAVNTSPFAIIITFDEAVTSFDASDITVGNGSAGNLQTSDNATFTADITPTAEGEVIIDIAAAVATDIAGNENTAASQLSINYDSSAPTAIIASSAADPTGDSPIPVIITWNEAVTGFEVEDITIANGSVGNLQTTDNTTFTADITPTADGAVTVDIAASVATDAVGNENMAATQFIITYATILGLEVNLASQLGVYPNPTKGELMIATGSLDAGEYQLRLVDVTGKEWLNRNVVVDKRQSIISLDLTNMPTGSYVLLLQNRDKWYNVRVTRQ